MSSPKIVKVNQMSTGIKGLVGRKMSKNVKFLGEDVKITKLTVAEVLAIQAQAKDAENDSDSGFEVLKYVVRTAVEGGDQLSEDDFATFPMDELSKLSGEIMKFSGLGQEAGK